MTKRWKLKMTSSNILLVLITLILIKAECITGEKNNSVEATKAIQDITDEYPQDETHVYVGNNEIAEYFFHSSVNDGSFLILQGINKCLENFQLITCAKMLLLNKINDALSLMEEPDVMQKDVQLLNGLLVFKLKSNTTSSGPIDENSGLSLDKEIADKVNRMFHKRSLLVNLLPNFKLEIEPSPAKHLDDFICFNYKFRQEIETGNNDINEANEGRKKKGGGMSMIMMVPQLIMMGLMPFTLASLKAMVMNAVMINMMALNGAIFMTIRNLVFGPRQGDNVKYVNYGYSKDRQTQSKRPVLIIHSPAAFVKQPPVHRKKVHGRPSSYHAHSNYFPENHNLNAGSSNFYHYQNSEVVEDDEDSYYIVQDHENIHHGQGQEIQKRNDLGISNGYFHFNITRQKGNNLQSSSQRIYRKDVRSQKPKSNRAQSILSVVQRNVENSNFKKNTGLMRHKAQNLREVNSYSMQHSVRDQIEAERKAEFKPSPQWDPIAVQET